ncbi:MAG TPA: glycosyl hydrolase [Armatimonadota bacterium]|nr:glycosyl hydrolase [Armatimonadota bacterium]
MRAFFRLVFLLLLVAAALLVWRPEWRQAALRAAEPLVARGWEALSRRPAAPPAPTAVPAAPPARVVPVTAPEPLPEEPVTEPEEAVVPGGNLPPVLPTVRPAPPLPPQLRALRAAAEARPSAAGYRRLADAAAAGGFTEVASAAYLREAAIYRKRGDPNAAAVEERKAGRYRAEGHLYLHARETPPDDPTRARLEPPSGALLGAFIDRDDQLRTTFMDENHQTHRDESEFAERVGKGHASLFCYLLYGRPFPARWAERLRRDGVIPHIAWEPPSLDEVADDGYLNGFADALARFDAPIFIRFAGEMNGEWTPYHGNPSLYREKFRLVYRVISRRAPKAAMIWCVNHVPDETIDEYYPGDDAVDWVGVNAYNVLYFDNNPSRPADWVHPADMLRRVYARYAARKPIAICEYAASHQAAVDPRPRPEYAATRIAQLYAALPRLFPRIKLVDWFDCNNLLHARAERQLNNYSLTDDPEVLRAYRAAIAPPYFLARMDERPEETIRPLRAEETVSGIVTLSAWVRAPVERARVYLLADREVLYAGDEPGAPLGRWDTRRVRPGAHTLRLLVLDREGRRILEERRTVRVAPAQGP